MIRFSHYGPEFEVVPQAIFWRPITYFAASIREDEDELDSFFAAYFTIGNEISFDLRCYRGHPKHTVSLYIHHQIDILDQINEIINMAVIGLSVPKTAIAWRRSEPFHPGKLVRSPQDRLKEPEARILSLKIASQCKNYTASTQYIKDNVPDLYPLSRRDKELSKTRVREAIWKQIIGNVISHRKTPEGPFEKGYATRTNDGLSVTPLGLSYLNSIGFSAT